MFNELEFVVFSNKRTVPVLSPSNARLTPCGAGEIYPGEPTSIASLDAEILYPKDSFNESASSSFSVKKNVSDVPFSQIHKPLQQTRHSL